MRFLIVLALLEPAAMGTQTIPPGEIVFQSDREGPTRLFILDVATKHIRRVGAPGKWDDQEPSWSRDGRRIAFGSSRAGNFDIWVMNADGSNAVRITDHPAPERDPVWAHDDKSLFFTGERDDHGQIYRVWLDDKRVERITNSPSNAIMPAASPDGRYLAWAAPVDGFQVFLMDFTNGTTRQITVGEGACRPSFDPSSQEVAFVRMGEPSRLEAVRETGRRVIHEDARLWSYYPDYSNDGRYVAFSVSPEHHQGEDWDLAILDLQNPGTWSRLTTGRGNDRYPDWRPSPR